MLDEPIRGHLEQRIQMFAVVDGMMADGWKHMQTFGIEGLAKQANKNYPPVRRVPLLCKALIFTDLFSNRRQKEYKNSFPTV